MKIIKVNNHNLFAALSFTDFQIEGENFLLTEVWKAIKNNAQVKKN
jgi:hypothetical protein